MDAILLAAAVLLLPLIAIVVVLGLVRRGRTEDGRDDRLRAGEHPGTDIGTATDRATGSTAWMRPGGGGV